MSSIIRSSSKDLLFGNLDEYLRRENLYHAEKALKNAVEEYTYPVLQTPKYSNDNINHKYNVISSLDWLSDNSSFVSISEDMGIRLFLTSPELLTEKDHQLVPFIRSYQDTPISSFSLHPSGSVYSGFCGSLVASNNLPLKFLNLIPDENGKSQLIKTFNIQDNQTERFNKIFSIQFNSDLSFSTGSNKSIQLFDINRFDPVSTVKTSGIISCLALSKSDHLPSGSFYSGSFNNQVNIHDSDGTITSSVTVDKGNGIIQIIESINGRYIFCICRNCTVIQILDLRMGLLPVGELESFNCKNQRIVGDIFPNSKGLIIGSADGFLNWYRDAELGLSSIQPDKILVNSETSIPSVKINKLAPQLVLTSQGDRNYSKPKIDITELYI